jgi:translation initiation factor IF-3
MERKPPMNEQIQAAQLRVVTPSPDGKDIPLGIMSRDEALAKAKEDGMDLILVNAQSDPMVCKIADYSRYRYMLEKKAKEVKKNSKATEVKEVKMSYKIDVHDYTVRRKSAAKFLTQGNRVRCTVMFRGREVQHDRLGFDLLEKLTVDLEKMCVRESKPKREGKMISVILSPRPELLKEYLEKRKNFEKAKKKARLERLEARDAALAAGTAVAKEDEEDDKDDLDDDEDGLDFEDSLESSLDELFGSDDLTDDLFS